MIIPYTAIDKETLYALVESFVLREGTDYGEVEISLEEKVAQVVALLEQEQVLIEYSEEHESVNIIEKP